MKLAYRLDIDGLRAIAVLAVVIFHFDKNWLPGGFLGVDIFFVISGFLITSIINKEIQSNTFSFSDFYLRRIKRIAPASLFYTAVVLLFCYVIFLPHDLDRAAKSALSTVFFASNFYFARNVDYFASSSEENPFLHTWSLSVEEQFYFIWPALLIALVKLAWSTKRNVLILGVLSLTSVALGTFWALSKETESLAFYMLSARLSELLLGAIGALYLTEVRFSEKQTKIAYLLGVLLILISFVSITENSIFPGVLAVPVCLGTLFIIIAGYSRFAKSSAVYSILSFPVSVYLGKISFSLYLAHWPILAFQRYIAQSYRLNWETLILSGILMLVMAHLTWRYIEKPFRNHKQSFIRSFLLILAIPSSVILSACVFIILNKGIPERFPISEESFHVTKEYLCHSNLSGDCIVGDRSNLLPYLLIGDSHAGHYLSYFDTLGNLNKFALEGRSVDACVGAFSEEQLSPGIARAKDCSTLKDYVAKNATNYSHIIIAERWDARVLEQNKYLELLAQFVQKMESKHVKVLLMAQVPKYLCDVNRSTLIQSKVSWAKQCNNEIDTDYIAANQIIADFASQHKKVKYISINEKLCQADCSPYIENQLAYKDDDHLNIVGAKLLAQKTKFELNTWFD